MALCVLAETHEAIEAAEVGREISRPVDEFGDAAGPRIDLDRPDARIDEVCEEIALIVA